LKNSKKFIVRCAKRTQTKYAVSVCIDWRTKRNKEIRNLEQLFFKCAMYQGWANVAFEGSCDLSGWGIFSQDMTFKFDTWVKEVNWSPRNFFGVRIYSGSSESWDLSVLSDWKYLQCKNFAGNLLDSIQDLKILFNMIITVFYPIRPYGQIRWTHFLKTITYQLTREITFFKCLLQNKFGLT
jgi:hypothetical protein